MLKSRTRRIVVLCLVLYVGYTGALVGLKLFYYGEYQLDVIGVRSSFLTYIPNSSCARTSARRANSSHVTRI